MWIIGLLTFALPWVFVGGISNPFLEPKELLFLAGGWGLILWKAFKLPDSTGRIWKNPWTLWLALWLVGWNLRKFYWLYLLRTPKATDVICNWYAWTACLMVVLALLLARDMALTWLATDFQVHRLTQWMCWSATAVACYALCQWMGWDQWYMASAVYGNVYGKSLYAGFGNPGYLVLYLACLTPLFLLFSSKRYLLFLGIILLAFVAVQVRYAWVIAGSGLLASLTARWWTRMRIPIRAVWLGALIALAVLVGQWAWPIFQSDDRLAIWTQALAKLQKQSAISIPSMTGYGLNAFSLLMGEPHLWAHNEWVQALLEIGVIGTLLLAGMVAWSLRSGWRMATHSILASGWFGVFIAFLTASLIHFPGHIMPVAWIGCCAWSIMERHPEAA